MKKPFLCKVGLHDDIYLGKKTRVLPPRGPFDPRTDEQRKIVEDAYICTQCGREKREVDSGDW